LKNALFVEYRSERVGKGFQFQFRIGSVDERQEGVREEGKDEKRRRTYGATSESHFGSIARMQCMYSLLKKGKEREKRKSGRVREHEG